MQNANSKAQAAMEYLMTYGWAIILIAIALGVIYELGILSPSAFVSSQCILGSGFSCSGAVLASSGTLTLTLTQMLTDTINITAVGCNSNEEFTNMQSVIPQKSLLPDENSTFSVRCYNNNTVFTGTLGSMFSGYVMVNYTDTITGAAHTVSGTLIQKVAR